VTSVLLLNSMFYIGCPKS